MGVSIKKHEHRGEKLYVFGMNEVGDQFTIVFNQHDDNAYEFRYALLPDEEWNGEVFQDVIDIRDAANEHIEEELDGTIRSHCIALDEQFIPREYWDEVDVDEEFVGSVDIVPAI